MKNLHVALSAMLLSTIFAHSPTSAMGGIDIGFGEVKSETLVKMYSGKTWIWSNGGGYFAPDNRFVAWTGSKSKGSYARGTWSVSDGRVCTKADWIDKSGSHPSKVCFEHRLQKHF